MSQRTNSRRRRVAVGGGTCTRSPGSTRSFRLIAVGGILLFSIYPVSRSLATAALAMGMGALILSAALAIYTSAIVTISSATNFNLAADWYIVQTGYLAEDFGILALGYLFMAYRGLSHPTLARRSYGRRRRVRSA